ncbi:hypothetical protein PFISCL1PPCAC_13111, partial [Pristionchus fissidentatus]
MVDKASGNYAFTCKKLYLRFMEKELNTENDGDKTYEVQDNTNSEDLRILHERFITGAHNSTLKPLSIELQKILKFLHMVEQLRTVSNSKCDIFCADFSSLFTNLPHNVVKEKLYFLFDILFKNAGSEYMVVHGMKVRYDRNNSSTSGRSYHKNDVKSIVDFILRNSYAFYGGKLYKQQKGIPQGNNASPQIADLTLAVMEYQYIKNHIKIDHTLAFSLNRTFRYIDDLFHISQNTVDFIKITSEMYHESLTLEQTNATPKESAFLNLSVRITTEGIVKTSLYNKTDDYSFSVVRYPHFLSNILW